MCAIVLTAIAVTSVVLVFFAVATPHSEQATFGAIVAIALLSTVPRSRHRVRTTPGRPIVRAHPTRTNNYAHAPPGQPLDAADEHG